MLVLALIYNFITYSSFFVKKCLILLRLCIEIIISYIYIWYLGWWCCWSWCSPPWCGHAQWRRIWQEVSQILSVGLLHSILPSHSLLYSKVFINTFFILVLCMYVKPVFILQKIKFWAVNEIQINKLRYSISFRILKRKLTLLNVWFTSRISYNWIWKNYSLLMFF